MRQGESQRGAKIKGTSVGKQSLIPFALKEGIQFPEVGEELDKHMWQIYLLFLPAVSISSRLSINNSAWRGSWGGRGRRKCPFFIAEKAEVDGHAVQTPCERPQAITNPNTAPRGPQPSTVLPILTLQVVTGKVLESLIE